MSKKIKITKKEYEDILYDNSKKITVKYSKKGLEYKEVIFYGIDVAAERIVDSNGVTYIKYEN